MNAELESQLRENGICAAYFWAVNCQKCRLFGPTIESASRSKGIALIKIDVGVERDVAVQYDVLSLPTLIFFWKGSERLRLTAGDMTIAEIKKACEEMCRLQENE